MKPIIIGADGTLGKHCAKVLKDEERPFTATTLFNDPDLPAAYILNLLDPDTWWIPEGTDTALLLAAEPSLEKCRKHPASTGAINVHATIAIMKWLTAKGVFTVFPSTNLVFDGTMPFVRADAPHTPKTVYGAQKARVEDAMTQPGIDGAAVRLTKVVGTALPMIERWAADLKRGSVITPFEDMVLSPISLDSVCRCLLGVAESRRGGTWQISGDRDISYAELAQRLASHIGVDPGLVAPMQARDALRDIEHLPRYTTLDDTRVRETFGDRTSDVWNTVDTVLNTLC